MGVGDVIVGDVIVGDVDMVELTAQTPLIECQHKEGYIHDDGAGAVSITSWCLVICFVLSCGGT